jgi:hypothetical protein
MYAHQQTNSLEPLPAGTGIGALQPTCVRLSSISFPLCRPSLPLFCYFSLASTIVCPLIPGGRYMHLAWLRTASDAVSSLGTDP